MEGSIPPAVYNVVRDQEYKGEIRVGLAFTPEVYILLILLYSVIIEIEGPISLRVLVCKFGELRKEISCNESQSYCLVDCPICMNPKYKSALTVVVVAGKRWTRIWS